MSLVLFFLLAMHAEPAHAKAKVKPQVRAPNAAKAQASTSVGLPSFHALASARIAARKKYLSHLKTVIDQKQYRFLDDLLAAPIGKNRRHCIEGIYGYGIMIKNSQTRLSCKQDLTAAVAFFLDDDNMMKWERFRLHVRMICMKSKNCQSFERAQGRSLKIAGLAK